MTHRDVRGTALTLQTALGSLLTLVTIPLTPTIAGEFGWRWAMTALRSIQRGDEATGALVQS